MTDTAPPNSFQAYVDLGGRLSPFAIRYAGYGIWRGRGVNLHMSRNES